MMHIHSNIIEGKRGLPWRKINLIRLSDRMEDIGIRNPYRLGIVSFFSFHESFFSMEIDWKRCIFFFHRLFGDYLDISL
jgi:hypothetical protein